MKIKVIVNATHGAYMNQCVGIYENRVRLPFSTANTCDAEYREVQWEWYKFKIEIVRSAWERWCCLQGRSVHLFPAVWGREALEISTWITQPQIVRWSCICFFFFLIKTKNKRVQIDYTYVIKRVNCTFSPIGIF